eukprot:scaffold2.g7047.t1
MGAAAVAEGPSISGRVVLPGDEVMRLPETGVVRVGGGLQADGEALVAVKVGTLQQAKNGKMWVESRQKRYIPAPDELVIGIVTERHPENYDVDIRGPRRALLPALAFEGATRRNRPHLQARGAQGCGGHGERRSTGCTPPWGDLVYCRVESANRDMEPTLTCVDAGAGFGQLKGGYAFEVSTGLARALLARPPAPVLAALGAALQFEVAVGQNGRVWIDAPAPATVILVANAVASAEGLTGQQQARLVAALLRGAGVGS